MYPTAAAVLAAHPDCPELARLAAAGYGIDYRLTEDESREAVVAVEARAAGELVGAAEFVHYGHAAYLSPRAASVDPGHRRRGVATALYVFAECLTRQRVKDCYFAHLARRGGARSFWLRPGRPFGWSPTDGVPWDPGVRPRYCSSPGEPTAVEAGGSWSYRPSE